MNRNYGSDMRPVCGYDPCPCRGVHFVSRYKQETDYCIDGKRIVVKDGGEIRSAAPLQLEKLIAYFADERAKYLVWHNAALLKYGDALGPISEPELAPHIVALAA
jgi:hypothetical protein